MHAPTMATLRELPMKRNARRLAAAAFHCWLAGLFSIQAASALRADGDAPQAEPPKAASRTFLFTYAGKVKDLPPGAPARVWLPMATTNRQQDVSIVKQAFPAEVTVGRDAVYGNTMLSFDGKADAQGEIAFAITYRVKRQEVQTGRKGSLVLRPETGEKVARYLQADAKVPLTGKPLDLLKEKTVKRPLPREQFAAARALYDIVNQHMTYKKVGAGWGQGDALWACESGYGNCTDFHSLFIAMARGSRIPSKFEMGFALPAKRGAGPIAGYHCWAWFLPDGAGWVPVDISEASQHPDRADYCFGNLSANRVSFSVGRDIELVPRQEGPALNFFVYPYVEVAGKAYPGEKIERTFSYKDVP